ncbi:ISL3 family transposase [uncultured Tyzzerella sp.]|uniref:ISL3 family transposase n=1 Tax=uncultured Tyzzerella sp. TaxID=2321398 RepID=UPI002943E8D2|nr:ISL3 family transposase [uncultured Tyzzerella sp.]
MDYDIIKNFIELDDVIIENVLNDEEQIQIYLKLEQKEHICPKCKNKVTRVHDYYNQKLRDLDILGKKTYIILKKRRYKCKCGKVFQEENIFLNKRQRMTKRLFFKILEMLRTTHSFTSVGRELGLSTNTIIRAFDRLNYPKADLIDVEVFSIDEFKGNTGGEKYNCIIADPKTKKVLDILPSRKFADLVDYVKNQKRKSVKYFVSDMWRPYKDLGETFFKNATFIVDKYHWTRQCIWAFENVRKEEQKKFYKEYRRYFKKSKSLLTKRFDFLTEEEKVEVNYMLYKSRNILIAHNLKEDFLKLMDFKNRDEAKNLLSKWILNAQISGLKPFVNCANTMIKWSDGILNSFRVPYTNGFIEGCNNKIKVLKRNAYGYRNFIRFRNRILHIFAYKKEEKIYTS